MFSPKQPRTDQPRAPGGARNLTEVWAQPIIPLAADDSRLFHCGSANSYVGFNSPTPPETAGDSANADETACETADGQQLLDDPLDPLNPLSAEDAASDGLRILFYVTFRHEERGPAAYDPRRSLLPRYDGRYTLGMLRDMHVSEV